MSFPRSFLVIYSTSSWSIETAGWRCEDDQGSIAFIPCDADGEAALILGTFRKDAGVVTDDELRQMSARGAPSDAPREFVTCGEFRGVGTRFVQDGVAWRVWWLGGDSIHIYATFTCEPGAIGSHDAVVEWMLSQLRVVRA